MAFRLLGFVLAVLSLAAISPVQAQRSSPGTSAVRFTSREAARHIPFEFHENHIYVRARVNDSGPRLFVLDTGASTAIDRGLAESLGLRPGRKERGFGAGEQPIDAAAVRGVSLSLPGVVLRRQTLAAARLSDLQKTLGRPVDGILGFSFFRHCVVEIDYVTRTIGLHSPQTYRHGRGSRIPLIIDADSGLIFARGRITLFNRPSMNGLFEIDTGGGHALILNSPFVERNKLLSDAEKEHAVSVGGLGGSSRAVERDIKELRLGGIRVANVKTLFSFATDGMLASEEFQGNIGGGVLKNYRVVLDYSRRLMVLQQQPVRRPSPPEHRLPRRLRPSN